MGDVATGFLATVLVIAAVLAFAELASRGAAGWVAGDPDDRSRRTDEPRR